MSKKKADAKNRAFRDEANTPPAPVESEPQSVPPYTEPIFNLHADPSVSLPHHLWVPALWDGVVGAQQGSHPAPLTFAGDDDKVNFHVPNGGFDQPFEASSSSHLSDQTAFGYEPMLSSAYEPLEYEAAHMESANNSPQVVEYAHLQGNGGNDFAGTPENVPVDSPTREPKGNSWTPQRCNRLGCRTNTTFKRKADYNRHMRKHTRSVSLSCPVQYCSRQGSRAFYRRDKFREHLEKAHTEDESCHCLVEGCTAGPIPLSILRLHVRGHYFSEFKRALGCGSGFHPKCELKKCKQRFYRTDLLQAHLLTHPLADRLSQLDVIKQMGLDPNTARIICPICHQNFTNSEEFVPHLEAEHLVTDSDHWLSFRKQVSEYIPGRKYIHPWEKCFIRWSFRYAAVVALCNYCGESAVSQPNSLNIDHHLAFLKASDLEEVIAVRAAILRLLPDFQSHPIFETDKRIVHRL